MSDGPSIAHFSLHQRDAPIDARERFASEITRAPGPDLFILGTCHRIEITCVAPPGSDASAILEDRLGAALPPEGRMRTGADAVRHVMRVACGLDSVIRGEGQVLGQLRRAFDAARGSTLDPALAIVIRRTLELGRELRRSTPLGGIRRSLGSLAVDAALTGSDDPARVTVLVLGAGEVGKLALRAVTRRAGRVYVANRDFGRAESLARMYGGTALPLERIDDALADAAVVIAAADTRGTVLTADRLRARLRQGPLSVIDLAVPRSLDADARDLGGLRYVDVDGLSDRAGADLDQESLSAIEGRCEAAALAVIRELGQRRSGRAIRALQERTERIRRGQLDRALARLRHLSDRDRAVVEALSEGLAHALMHEPTVRLREEPDREAAARDLFAL